MIYVNGKILDFTNKDPQYQFASIVKDYHGTIADLKSKHGDAVLFQTPSAKPRIDLQTKRQRPPKPYSWPYKTNITTPDGTQSWVYSKSAVSVKDGVVEPTEPNFIIAGGDRTVSLTEDPDLVFFLTKIRAFQRGKLWIYNPKELEDARANELMKEAKVRDMIYSEHSPLNVDVSLLRSIAGKWGVANVETTSLNGLRNSLHDLVIAGQSNKKKRKDNARGIDDFLSDCGGGESVKIGADIQAALDQGALRFNRNGGVWELFISKGEKPMTVMTAGMVGGDEARARLMSYLGRNKSDAEMLRRVVKGEAKVEYGRVVEKAEDEDIMMPEDVSLENIDKIGDDGKHVVNFRMLQKAAKVLGIKPPIGTTTENLRALVREKLEQMAQLN